MQTCKLWISHFETLYGLSPNETMQLMKIAFDANISEINNQ